ncbi:Hypothetical predicted protein [Pelobates cultripes]|uniref:exodeoxyribonuclease III n=1 Tax=Pelobates cultripes TaxID=61616 RepID=A0AAD1TAB9_PELCU|nr:Hypothetical predicted protein [Pelobates cultripes]
MRSGFDPAPLRLWSNNIRGLNVPERRSHLLRSLGTARTSIAFLQETHFRGESAPTLKDASFPQGYFANHPTAKKAGVAILFACTVPFECTNTLADEMGWFLFLMGTIAGSTYMLATIYAPNARQHRFLRETLRKLERFREGLLIVAGDLNVALDPRVDTSRGTSSISTHCLQSIRAELRGAGLADCWRVLHPSDRDYSYFSTVHKHYSRLDYIFLAQEFLPLLLDAGIGMQGWSDHSPILASIKSPLFRPRDRQWRMNESILNDGPTAADIWAALVTYFTENDTPEVPALTIWEAHECAVRGHLIKVCTRRKKEQQRCTDELLQRIADLEGLHKTTQSDVSYKELLENRKKLRDILHQKLQYTIRKSQRFFYEYSDQQVTQLPEKITEAFRGFYEDLYNLPTEQSEEAGHRKDRRITDYLQQHITKSLSREAVEELEDEITLEELQLELKSSKLNKVPEGVQRRALTETFKGPQFNTGRRNISERLPPGDDNSYP